MLELLNKYKEMVAGVVALQLKIPSEMQTSPTATPLIQLPVKVPGKMVEDESNAWTHVHTCGIPEEAPDFTLTQSWPWWPFRE